MMTRNKKPGHVVMSLIMGGAMTSLVLVACLDSLAMMTV